jgi:hypothetical protein
MRRFITGLAIAAGLAVPSTASAATGTIAIQPMEGSQVVADVSVEATQDDLYYGVASWFAYALQVDGAQACSPSSAGEVAMLSTALSDGDVPRDANGHFTAIGSYSTAVKFTPTHSPLTRLCLYATSLGRSQQIVADAVIDTPSSARYRIGAICMDGWRSSSTGSGTCSSHGGVSYWLYNNPAPTATPVPPAPVAPRPPIYATPQPPSAPTPSAEEAEEPINQSVICRGHLVSEPRLCSIRAGRVKLSRLHWQSWGDTAKATGKVSIDGSKLRTATITLSRPMPSTYTKMTIKMAHGKTRHFVLRSN